MKVRIAVAANAAGWTGRQLAAVARATEDLGFDSIWFPERATAALPDPIATLGFVAGATTRLKIGPSVLVVPGRNPALLAGALASLDRLSGGRLLPAVGLGIPDRHEQAAFGVERRERAAIFDEVLPLLRRFWSGEAVTHDGPRYRYDGLRIEPTPVQDPLEVWMGGRAPSELRRAGRLGDGWLPSFTTPTLAVEGRAVVEAAATEAGRAIDPEHWGAFVPYARAELPEALVELLVRRGIAEDPAAVVPVGLDALRALLEGFVDVGFTKLVVSLPGDVGVDELPDELARLAEATLDLQR